MRLAHCMTYVCDLERSIRFYEELLGYRVLDRHRYPGHRLAFVGVGADGFELELIEAEGIQPMVPPATPCWHFAFAVEDLDREFARVCALRCRVDPIIEYHANGSFQTRYFYVYDPDGNQIEFLEAIGRFAPKRRPLSDAEAL